LSKACGAEQALIAMSGYYANITVRGPEREDVVAFLKKQGVVAYVSPAVKGATVIWHEDLGSQEPLAASLSGELNCAVLVVMGYGEAVLMYTLYRAGAAADSYVSSPHEGLELDGPAPEGDARVLAGAFGIDMDHLVARVERILRKPARQNTEYAYAVNRHGELAKALGLPVFAAGSGFNSIEVGELPEGQDFDASALIRTP
jgi:hypothetical protein